ncbi:MAG TPA: HAD hydrolase family protein, partial [Methanosarcinales archaeon]|nr:HAD hydrolase family protein [Methanosarcinales archaeon]
GGVISMGFDGLVHVSGDKVRCQEVLGILGEHFDLEELDGSERRSDVALRRNFDIDAAKQVVVDGNIRGIELVDTGFAVHIKTLDVNKGTALVSVAEMMGLDTGDFVAIGDSVNDIEMIRTAGLGVAVGNAHPALKDAADLVTAGQYGAGVVEALKDSRLYTW